MTRETYMLVEYIHLLYIINYIFFILRPCIQLPIIPTHSLSFFHASAYYSTTFSYISLFLFLSLVHIKCIQITHASLFPQVNNHTYNHRTSMSSFHSPLWANILPFPSVLLLHQHFHRQNFLDFLSFVHTLYPFLCH